MAIYPQGLSPCGEATVTKVTPNADIHTEVGAIIRLSGILLPKYWPEDTPYKSWPHAKKAHQALEALLQKAAITLLCRQHQKATATDSRGRYVRHIWLDGQGLWVQQSLLEKGHAFAYGITDNADLAAHLLSAESRARRTTTGLWPYKGYTVQDALGESLRPGWFQLVEGTVHSTKQVRDKIFLNFDENWRTDFTIEIPIRLATRYAHEDAFDVMSLTGQKIEVRGFLEWAGGPKIILSHKYQLQTLAALKEQPAK